MVVPLRLDPAFPAWLDDHFIQTDRPITYLHVHDGLEIGYCFSGSGIFVVGEKVLPYQAGDAAFISSSEVHLAASAPGTQSEWAWIYLDPLRLGAIFGAETAWLDPAPFSGPGFENMLAARDHPAIGRIVLRMIEELREKKPGAETAFRALTWEMMVLMHRTAPPARGAEPAPRRDYARLAPALHALARDYATPLRTGALARLCGLSEPHFRRLFSRTIGRPPRDYWNGLRLRMAASMLSGTARSILEISQEVGFDTLSSFNRLFRAAYGQSPRAWRSLGKADKAPPSATPPARGEKRTPPSARGGNRRSSASARNGRRPSRTGGPA